MAYIGPNYDPNAWIREAFGGIGRGVGKGLEMAMLKKEKDEEEREKLERQLELSGYSPYSDQDTYSPYDQVVELKNLGKYVKKAKPYEVEEYEFEKQKRPFELESMKADIAAKQALAKYREQAKQTKITPKDMSTKDILKAVNDIDKAALYLDEDQQISTLAVKNQLLDEYYSRIGAKRPEKPEQPKEEPTGMFGGISKFLSGLGKKSEPTKPGGKLMIDKNGNKAYVYPDGSIQEVE
jgi:hypothetical protein